MKNNDEFDKLKNNKAAIPMCQCHVDLPNGKPRQNQKREIDLGSCERNLRVKRSHAIKVMKFWQAQGKGTYSQKGSCCGEGRFVWNDDVNSKDYCEDLWYRLI